MGPRAWMPWALSLCSLLPACALLKYGGSQELALFTGEPQAHLRVQLAGTAGERDLVGPSVNLSNPDKAGVPDNQLSARRSTKTAPGDALTMQWKNAWSTSLRLVADKPMDLRPWLAGGTLEFDVEALDMARAGLTFAMGCGPECARKVPYVVESRALQGSGWRHLSFPLQCFARDGNDFSAITQPFVVESSGSGEVSLANVKIVRNGKPNADCPDYHTESVTPAPLTEVWTLDWWMTRHEQKLEEIRQLRAAGSNPQVVFFGDSITHGWENQGKAVWERYYGKYHALDLGFSGDRTENLLWRLEHGEVDGIRPKVVVVMIGTNNTGNRQEDPATTAAGVRRIVDELRHRLPDTKILLLAVFPRDEQATSQLRQINERVNGLVKGFDDGRYVHFLNINAALVNRDGTLSREVMPDLLHPNEKGYALWAQAMDPTLQRLLSQ